MATTTRRQTKKEIWDWKTLLDAISAADRLKRQTDVSAHALGMVEHRWRYDRNPPPMAQMDERVVAVGGATCISLWYMHTPKETALSGSSLHDWVQVYPCAGGRTTYRIDDSVNGWFANRHLPINANQRRCSSGYRSDQYWHGQSGVYQKGTGPYYPDAGPDLCNASPGEIADRTSAAVHLPEQWREAALSLVQRLSTVLSPFRDVILRYNAFGYDPDSVEQHHDSFSFRSIYRKYGEDDNWSRTVTLSARHGLTVRLKSPCVAGDGGWEIAPDLAISVTGACPAIDGSPEVNYMVQMLHPNGSASTTEYVADGSYSTGLDFVVTRHQQKVIEAARQWAASRIYIPCI